MSTSLKIKEKNNIVKNFFRDCKESGYKNCFIYKGRYQFLYTRHTGWFFSHYMGRNIIDLIKLIESYDKK